MKVKEQNIQKSIYQKIKKSKKEIHELNFEIKTDKKFYLVKEKYLTFIQKKNVLRF